MSKKTFAHIKTPILGVAHKLLQTKVLLSRHNLLFGSWIAFFPCRRVEVLVRGGALVKSLRWFLMLMILGLSSTAVLADSIDPKMGVIGGGGSDLWTGSFTFTINNDVASCEEGICDFTSGAFFITEGTLFNFDFSFDTEQGPFSPLDGDPVFPIVTTIVPGFEALLSGGTIFPASDCIECFPTSNQIFGDFKFVMDGVVENSKVTVTSNVPPVPEPGTMVLLLSGFGAMGLRRLRRGRVPS